MQIGIANAITVPAIWANPQQDVWLLCIRHAHGNIAAVSHNHRTSCDQFRHIDFRNRPTVSAFPYP